MGCLVCAYKYIVGNIVGGRAEVGVSGGEGEGGGLERNFANRFLFLKSNFYEYRVLRILC